MAASYPTSIKTFTTRSNGQTIDASHVNDLQDEVNAIETDLINGMTNTLKPKTNDGAALGTTLLMWSDLFLATGAVINFNNGNVTVTHSSGNLAVANADVSIAATKKLYLDGGGDTYLTERVANAITFYAGGSSFSWEMNSSGFALSGTNPTTASAANCYIANGDYLKISTSSIRYKHDVMTLDANKAKDAVMAMRPVTYRGKTDEDQRRFVGFIAEEMQEIAPLLCTYDEGGESGTSNYVTYDRITAYLVSVVQQQQTEIDALKAALSVC